MQHLHMSLSHVLMSFLNTSNVFSDLILIEKKFQIFGPREVRLFEPNS